MKGLFLSGVIGLIVLCLLCPSCQAPAIENDVRSAALICAGQAGLDPGIISVSGPDVTLAGYIQSEEQHAHLMSCIAAFPGTRTIDDRLVVQTAGALGFRTHFNDITISGIVPSEAAHGAIINRAFDLWGVDNVTDALEVDAGRTIGGWSGDDFAQFLAILRHSRRDLDIELGRGQAVVAGTVLSELARIRVLG